MHILFITDNFPPELNAPATRTFEHCRRWVTNGAEVTVITGAPNFPTGKIYNGYRNAIFQVEYQEGIKVIRVWTFITSNSGVLLRAIDYLSFMISSIVASFFVRNVSVIIGTSPQFFSVCSAYVISLLKRRPWVFELRDIWPESIITVGALNKSVFLKLLAKIEDHLYKRASLIIPVTHSFVKYLVSKKVSNDRIKVITNGVDKKQYYPRKKDKNLIKELGLENKFIVGYVGTIGMAHGLQIIVDAAVLLSKRHSSLNVHFLIIGEGAEKEKLKKAKNDFGLTNVSFHPAVSKAEMPHYLSIIDISLVHLLKKPLFKQVIPSKIFESCAMGIPILIGVDGEARKIIEQYDVGLFFEPENCEMLISRIIQVLEDDTLTNTFYENCSNVSADYDRDKLSRSFLIELEKLLR